MYILHDHYHWWILLGAHGNLAHIFIRCIALYRTISYPRRLIKHVASYRTLWAATYTLLHNTKGYIEKLSLWIKIKQTNLETCIDHAPACVLIVRKKGHGHCTFPSRVTIPRQKRVNLSTRLWHYHANSSFSSMIDREATKVLCRACAQTIILAVHKVTCGKKGQKQGQEKDFPVLSDSRSRYVEICNETRSLIL